MTLSCRHLCASVNYSDPTGPLGTLHLAVESLRNEKTHTICYSKFHSPPASRRFSYLGRTLPSLLLLLRLQRHDTATISSTCTRSVLQLNAIQQRPAMMQVHNRGRVFRFRRGLPLKRRLRRYSLGIMYEVAIRLQQVERGKWCLVFGRVLNPRRIRRWRFKSAVLRRRVLLAQPLYLRSVV